MKHDLHILDQEYWWTHVVMLCEYHDHLKFFSLDRNGCLPPLILPSLLLFLRVRQFPLRNRPIRIQKHCVRKTAMRSKTQLQKKDRR